ncbi:MAG TPA: hypothetical protein EYG16_09675 [Deltaproteobacteria bacterium]|nr:hypothetical protein [Candidatus Binatota bacterium]HIL13924.1 hypothetical protein [Deltaproteobacteria bacterium]
MARWLCILAVLLSACTQDPWDGQPAIRLGGIARQAAVNRQESSSRHRSDHETLYRSLDRSYRPLLGYKAGPLPPVVTVHATFELKAWGKSVLEFAYGMPTNDIAPAVTFRVSASSDNRVKTLLETSLDPAVDGGRWHEFSVELDLDQATTLQFVSIPDKSRTAPAEAWFSDPVLQPLNPERTEMGGRLPNVILISLDTLRADHLSAYGYQRNTSPNMKALFDSEGLVVENCFAPEVTTLDSHASMMSGLYPATAVGPGIEGIHNGVVMLAELMAAAGYRTAAFTENAFVAGELGFRRGFEAYNENPAIEAKGFARIAANSTGFARETFDRGLTWIEDHADQPLFVFLHTYQVHAPYTPPPEWAALFPSPDGASQARLDMDAYDAEIAYTDSEVGRLVKSLDRLLPASDTILIVLSDHGEEFGEHGRRGHGGTLANEVLRVPLMLRAPGRLPAGQRRTGPVGLVDLVPTLLELLELEQPYPLQGRSVLGHLVNGSPLPVVPLFAEAGTPFCMNYQGVDKSWSPTSWAITLWPDRLVSERAGVDLPENTRRYSMFDLVADPHEATDVYGFSDHGPLLKRMLDAWPAQAAERGESLARPVDFVSTPELAAEKIRKLRALGYLEPGE